MKKILLIDADSTIPNLPLMKLSTWHKQNDDQVNLIKYNLPYYPNKKKKVKIIDPLKIYKYDLIYCSIIFKNNSLYIRGHNIIFGGSGVDLKTTLPQKIEKLKCDYSLYPENDTSYGFLTRGCIRNCSHCVVPQKEGNIKKVASISDIVRHKKVKFLDNNILAYPNHLKIFQELIDKKIKCQFNQGLDIRLINKENSDLLFNLNYIGEYLFAFDNWNDRKIIEKNIKLLNWRKNWELKFFVYVHPKMQISNIVSRIRWLKENRCLPYIMRDIKCWNRKYLNYHNFYIDIAAYCNQPNLFKTMNFKSFLFKRHRYINRIQKSLNLWNSYA